MNDKKTQLIRSALQEIQKLRAKVTALDTPKHQDIAVIGMGCQFPQGANNLDQFWQLLVQGYDAITEVPADRWDSQAYYDENPDTVGKIHTTKAGFLNRDIKAFDASFFNMTPKEVICLDPQQRLLLEVTYQALENAHITSDDLHQSNTGVYVGMAMGDYAHEVLSAGENYLNAYYATGNSLSIAAGRIAYFLGTTGPAMVIDTACSSSLVATHLAIKALRAGECEQAIVGGVNVLLSPETSVALSTAHMLSKDGHCKTYAADANGYVRAEGCGVILLKPLSVAENAGDHILAVIKGSAINQDGASGGLTVPNGLSQQQVIKAALKDAHLTAQQISYVETHGTGTHLGDPIEINALDAVFSANRDVNQALTVASVKTNIGHLEAAAGMAGLIKTILSLKHRYLPQHLHFNQPNPHINWQKIAIKVNAQAQTWTHPTSTLSAGVSSFGFSGTNAHVVLQNYKNTVSQPKLTLTSPYLLPLSAKSEQALQERVADYALFLAGEINLSDTLLMSSQGRNHYPYRLAVVAKDKAGLIDRLKKIQPHQVTNSAQGIVFLFTGQGAQYHKMGYQLYQTHTVFTETIDQCAAIINHQGSIGLTDLLYDLAHKELINQTQYTQVALFATEYALTVLWKSWGIEPQAVAGHSVGEYVALCVAGVLSLQQALHLVIIRSQLMQDTAKKGAMATVFASAIDIEKDLAHYKNVTFAAFNAPQLQVISGQENELLELCQRLKAQGIASQRLAVSHAFHSALMEPMLAAFATEAEKMTFQRPQMPLLSNLDGQQIDTIDANYLVKQLRQPVYFQAMIENFATLGYTRFLEIGSHPVLVQLGQQSNPTAQWIPSLIKGQEDTVSLQNALALLYQSGINIDWKKRYSYTQKPDIILPNYPFQRQPYWVTKKPITEQPLSIQPSNNDTFKEQQMTDYLDDIKKIMSQITGMEIDNLNSESRFLNMGLDSLLLVQLQQAIARQFSLDIPISEFYQALDSISKIATHLETVLLPHSEKQTVVKIKPTEKDPTEINPLSNEQITTVCRDPNLGTTERLMTLQMQQMSALINRQLDVLQTLNQPQPYPIGTTKTPVPAVTTKKPHITTDIAGLYKKNNIEKNDLSPQQQTYLDKLIQRFNQRTEKSKRSAQQHKKVLAHNRNVAFKLERKETAYQIALQTAYGSKIIDIDGNEYIDITMGFGVHLFGHNPDFIKAALLKELQQEALAIGPISRLVGDVAQLMHELTGLDRTAFFNTGSEAVMVALRIARGVTKRDKIVVFSGSYHGSFDGVLATGWHDEQGAHSFPLTSGTLQHFVDDLIVLQYGESESLEIIEQLGDSLAAVLVEPIQSRNPSLQPKAFIKKLREITEHQGTALIFDETITGFRFHLGGAQALYGVKADMATYGKVLGGGLPIGAIAGSAYFMGAIDGGDWQFGDASLPTESVVFIAGTFNMHPLTMAAANAVLTYLKEQGERLQTALNEKTTAFCRALNHWFNDRQVPIELIHCCSLFRFQMQGDIDLLNLQLLDKGILIWDGRNCFFSTAHTDEDIEKISTTIKQCVEEMFQANGFVTKNPNRSISTPVQSIRPIDKQTDYPVSNTQQRLWTLEQFDPQLTVYNLPVVLILEEKVNTEAMNKAIQSLLMRHQSLRTYFIEQEGIPRQKIAPVATPILEEISLNSVEEVKQRAIEEADTPFDLTQAPLIRIKLVHLPTQDRLIINVHHIISDLSSMGVLADNLFRLYNAYKMGLDNPLLPLTFHYKDYNHWLNQQSLQEHRDYWQKKMSAAPILKLPEDQQRPPIKTYAGDFYRFGMTRQVTDDFVTFCREQEITVYMGMTAMLTLLMAKRSGQHDIVIGSLFLGREHPDLADQIGFYVNTLPLRNKVNFKTPLSQFLKQVKQTILDAGKYQAYPFERLLDDLQLPRDVSRNPLFDIVITMDDRSEINKLEQHHHFKVMEIDPPGSQFDIILYVNFVAQKLQVALNYNTDVYKRETIDALSIQLMEMMQRVTVIKNVMSAQLSII